MLLAAVKRPWASTVKEGTVLALPYDPAVTDVLARFKVTAPDVPPPVRPVPAVTPVISAPSFTRLKTPVLEL